MSLSTRAGSAVASTLIHRKTVFGIGALAAGLALVHRTDVGSLSVARWQSTVRHMITPPGSGSGLLWCSSGSRRLGSALRFDVFGGALWDWLCFLGRSRGFGLLDTIFKLCIHPPILVVAPSQCSSIQLTP